MFIISIPVKTAQLAVTTTKAFKQLASNDENEKKRREPKSKLGKKLSEKTKILKARLNKTDDKLKDSSTSDNKGVKIIKQVGKTVARVGIKTLKLIVLALQILAMFLTTFGLISCLMMILGFFLIFGAVGYVVAVMDSDNLGNYSSVASGGTINQTTNTTTASADVQKIINMSESEVWSLISEGKYASYSDANKAAQANPTAEEAFWSGLLVDVQVPCWKWTDDNKTAKQSSTTTIKVNKYVADYFKAYMTDLYNLPEQYVIVSVGGYSFRTKNNGSGTSNYSGHSFGATLDINPDTDGMGSVPANISNGHPWKTSQGLADPLKSECCTYDNSWHELAKSYSLEWGGNWSEGSLDPMHFSLVGDTSKDTRKFENKYEGRTP